MVSVDKHQSPSLKYTGPSVVPMPPGEPDFEPSLCQTCLGDHAFQRGVLSQEKESCSWETQSGCEVSLLWVHSPERILGLCVFFCIRSRVCFEIYFFLLHICKASEENVELWPVLACCTSYFFNRLYFLEQFSVHSNAKRKV